MKNAADGGFPASRLHRRTLVGLELGTGAAALAGGVLLMAAPDGSLLRADPAVLAGSPFPDWSVPGALLATLVGGGFLLSGWWQQAGRRHARELSVAAGAGLIAFEAAELGWIGFQPLEALFALAGAAVIVLAWSAPEPQRPPRPARRAGWRAGGPPGPKVPQRWSLRLWPGPRGR
jgi:hypothetical protein